MIIENKLDFRGFLNMDIQTGSESNFFEILSLIITSPWLWPMSSRC